MQLPRNRVQLHCRVKAGVRREVWSDAGECSRMPCRRAQTAYHARKTAWGTGSYPRSLSTALRAAIDPGAVPGSDSDTRREVGGGRRADTSCRRVCAYNLVALIAFVSLSFKVRSPMPGKSYFSSSAINVACVYFSPGWAACQ